MNIHTQLDRLEEKIGVNIDRNAEYTLCVGPGEVKFIKTVNGQEVEIAEGEWAFAVNEVSKKKDFGKNIHVIPPVF